MFVSLAADLGDNNSALSKCQNIGTDSGDGARYRGFAEHLRHYFDHRHIVSCTWMIVIGIRDGQERSFRCFSVLNSFLIWSLIRSYLPFLTQDYRSSLVDFERTVYGIQQQPPMWYFCTKLVDNWMPLAVDVLQNNPGIIMVWVAVILYLYTMLVT